MGLVAVSKSTLLLTKQELVCGTAQGGGARTVSMWPLTAAQCSAVLPSLDAAPTCAPTCSSVRTASSLPLLAAQWMARSPLRACASTSAPRSPTSVRSTSTRPLAAAQWIGRAPSVVGASTLMPSCTSRRVAFGKPRSAAAPRRHRDVVNE